jgi:nucleoside-diphosphate-sugar epimerase
MEKSKQLCLVAGGAGFIGSNLCEKLLMLGFRVMVLDNLITGNPDNLKKISDNPDFKFIKCDITAKLPADLPKMDFIFHFASPASVPDYQRYPLETALVNTTGTKNLLEMARINQAAFLFASTSEIYGNPLEHPQKESYWGNVNPVGVRSCYDESKRFGETLTMIYHRQYQTNVRIIRIFNTYGPNMRPDDGRVVSNFINQAISGKPITVYGTGEQTRSFCFIADLINGIIRAMFEKETAGEIFNLGNPDERTMNDLAQLVRELSGSDAPIQHHTLPQDDPEKRKPDISKARELLKWFPEVPVREGILKTIAYYRYLKTGEK